MFVARKAVRTCPLVLSVLHGTRRKLYVGRFASRIAHRCRGCGRNAVDRDRNRVAQFAFTTAAADRAHAPQSAAVVSIGAQHIEGRHGSRRTRIAAVGTEPLIAGTACRGENF